MKKLVLALGLVLTSATLFAQTGTGFHVTPTITAVDVTQKLPLNTYLGDKAKQNLNLGAEVGYFGEVLGLAATAQSDFDMDSPVLLGAKLYANVFTLENIRFKAEVGAKSFLKDVSGSQRQYTGGVSANVPLVDHFDAKLGVLATTFDKFDKYYAGVQFGISYKL